ncbi:btb/poz domain-containing protein fbl11, partial [Quercus suber]
MPDLDLQYISKFCASLHDLNLKGCISVTDVGISNLICNCMKLHSIVVCDTSFGKNSVLALCSGISSNYGNSLADDLGWNHNSLISNLQKLHIGGCKSVDETSLLELLSQTKMLKSLCLRDTRLVDHALHCFSGSSLEMLDISNIMVSAAALAYVVHGNPGLKCLNAISETVIMNILAYLRNLGVLALCYCLGDISMLSFSLSMQNLRKLRLERVTPRMTNNDLVILTQNCATLVELSLLGCKLLNSGQESLFVKYSHTLITVSLFSTVVSFLSEKSSLTTNLPMLRKISLDLCDASGGDFDIPD